MYVACPACQSLYSITAAQLGAAGGQVRCSQCRTVFDAVSAVFDDPRQALTHRHPRSEDVAREIDALVDRALDQVSGVAMDPGETRQADTRAQAPVRPAAADPSALPGPVETPRPETAVARQPGIGAGAERSASGLGRSDADCYAQPCAAEFVPPGDGSADDLSDDPAERLLLQAMTVTPEPRTRWGALGASLLLTLTLLAQYAWWDRNRLAQLSALRPALDWLCQPLACNLPLRHDLARVEMVEREVRDHPNVKDALLVSAAFVNRASYVQAYPVLQIAFSDISGAPVAVRRFRPEEYLHDTSPARGMAPGEQTLVMLEVVDPGKRAVSFQFDFL